MLKDELRECKCCNRLLFASANSLKSNFSTYVPHKNGVRYYNSWCKECHRAYRNSSIDKIKMRYKEAREKRNWTIYKLTIDTTVINSIDRASKLILKNKYIYTGITKQEPRNRLYKHVYDLKINRHSNFFMQELYNKIRSLYLGMNDDTFIMFFMKQFVHFEEVSKLDPRLDYKNARLVEKIYVYRLEHEIRKQHKSIDIHSYSCMSVDLDHSKQTKEYKDELTRKYAIIGNISNKKSLDIASI